MKSLNGGKKPVRLAGAILLMAVLLVTMAGTASADDSIKVFVDGQEVNYGDTPPRVIDGRTMVGLRSLALALGVAEEDIQWMPEANNTIWLQKDDSSGYSYREAFWLDATDYSVKKYPTGAPADSSEIYDHMDTAPVLVNDRVYMPVRYVAEGFDYTVSYDAATGRVLINSGKEPNNPVVETSNMWHTDTQSTDPTPVLSAVPDGRDHTWFLDVDSKKLTVKDDQGTHEYTLTVRLIKDSGTDMFGTYKGRMELKDHLTYNGKDWTGTMDTTFSPNEWGEWVHEATTDSYSYAYSQTHGGKPPEVVPLGDNSDDGVSWTMDSDVTSSSHWDRVDTNSGYHDTGEETRIVQGIQTFVTVDHEGPVVFHYIDTPLELIFNGYIGHTD